MKISVLGLGYVGSVTAACLAKQGHEVVGADANPRKAELINSGQTPVLEPSLEEMVRDLVRDKRLRATPDTGEAVKASDLSLVCVGTPSLKSGRLDLAAVERVSREIGQAIRGRTEFHTTVVRSTVLPGTVETLVIPALEAESGKRAGEGFAVCYNPEFMREGTAVADFYAPPFTVIGASEERHAEPVASLYAGLNQPMVHTSIRLAEMLKYVCNAYHALKITFANEVGTLARAAGVDSHELMRVFCSDQKLNISRAYLEPGFAFGGSCLPKDIRSLLYHARELDLSVPVLEAVLPSNQSHLRRGLELVLSTGKKRVGVLGLSFKPDTDDLRESPMVDLVKTLLGEGCEVKIYDPKVELSAIVGANKQFIEQTIPHIGALLCSSFERVVKETEVIVLGRDPREFPGLRELLRPEQVVVELARARSLEGSPARHVGICW